MHIDKDFKKMKIPPFGANADYSILKDIPKLKDIDVPTVYKKKVINFVLLAYDPESPFVKRYQNVKKRILAVCDYTGLSSAKNEKLYNSIIGYNNQPIILAIDSYVKWLNSRLWSQIVANETAFYEYQGEVMETVEGDSSKDKLAALNTKTKILEALDQISLRLDGYYSQLYQNDERLENIVKTKMVTPESIANGEVFDF